LDSNGPIQGGKVASRSFLVQLLVGLTEIIGGFFTFSVALISDGTQSFADAGVSLIVWIGLRISRRAPDGKFHFGYYRVETFSSMIAALFMGALGAIALYESYRDLLNPKTIADAPTALIVALGAMIVSSALLVYKKRAAEKYRSLALKTDAANSIKDVLTSIVASIGIVVDTYFNFPGADAIAGIIISLFVFTMVYPAIKEASLVLLDACQCSDILQEIENIAVGITHVKGVHDIRMRKMGPYLVGDMHVAVDGNMTVKEADKIASDIEERVKKKFDEVLEMKVRIEPHELQDK